MATPDVEQVDNAARDMVRAARKDDSLRLLTLRIVREKLETKFALEKGTLDKQPFKGVVKEAVQDEVNSHQQTHEEGDKAEEEDLSVDQPGPSEQDKTHVAKAKPKRKPRSKVAEEKSIHVSEEQKGTSRGGAKKKLAKASSIVDSSEDEEDFEGKTKSSQPSMHKVSKSPLKVPVKADQLDGKKVKAKPKRQPKKIAPVADSENDDNPSPSNARLSGADSQDVGSNPKAPAKPSSGEKDTTTGDGEASESERSIIIDETPKKRKRKIKEPDESQKQPKEKKQKKGAVQLSKDEETVKRLKAIVYACGVRKVWSKEFQNIDKPSQQIKKIKDVIAELGMNGRPTLEKAKAIKAKRELAKELEDVRAFGEAHASQSEKNRSKQGSTALASSVEAEGASDNDSINEEVPPRKKKTAWQSISAFLDDQSDEE